MGENINKEIRLTIQPNGAAVHPCEPIPPSHTNHSIGQLGAQSKWWEEMMRKIDKSVTAPDTSPSNTKSDKENVKISIPPKKLLEAKKKSYWDENLTIGPLYTNLVTKSCLEDCKALCVKKFMQRHDIGEVTKLIECLIPNPHDLNNHYSNLSQDNIKDFQLLVTIDTVFIHEFLFFSSTVRSYCQDKQHEFLHSFFNNKIKCNQEPIISTDYLYDFFNNDFKCNPVWRNLFLMGNQIPMSFLKKIAEFPNKNEVNVKDLETVLVDILVRNCPFPMGSKDWFKYTPNPIFLNCKHLLDCQYVLVTQGLHEHKRSLQFPDHWSSNQGAGRLQSKHRDRLPTASQLSKVGISFKAYKSGTSVIKYNGKKLQLDLPRLVVYEGTEDVLRNLIAYEQTSKEGGEFTMYAVIMDSLIDTTEDLAILTKARVIVNHLGSDDELVKMWNNMSKNVTIRSCKRWDDMTRNVLKHYRDPLSSMYVEFHEKFFSRPWLTVSVITAILLLILTLLQTVYTILGYY